VSHIRPLDGLRAADEDQFGGKSTSLGELMAAEIPVPPGFAISTSAFHACLAAAGVDASGATHDAVRAAEVPEEVRTEIAAAYESLARSVGEDQPAVAVRSSAVGEDSGEATFAGQQETYLWVRGAAAVCDAVRDCWASTFSGPAMSYRARMAADRRPEMGVTVQLMVDAAVSGVMFTCSPVSGDPSVVAVNASWGLGLGVVGGEVTPDEYLVSKVTGEVVRRNVAAKHIEYRADPSGSGTVCVDVPEERQSKPALDEDRLAELVAVARRVQKYFGSHQDVEWAFAQDGALYVVQSRPVTATGAPAKEAEAPASALSMVMSRFGAGGGTG
jgi:pyruvate,water dikinase